MLRDTKIATADFIGGAKSHRGVSDVAYAPMVRALRIHEKRKIGNVEGLYSHIMGTVGCWLIGERGGVD